MGLLCPPRRPEIKNVNFYLIIATIIAGAVVTIAKDGKGFLAAGFLVLLLPFLSFIFWKLDLRNKFLIRHGEEAIKMIEHKSGIQDEGEEPNRLKLFLHEEYATDKLKRLPYKWHWSAHFSYSTCFNLVFLVFSISGFISAVVFMYFYYISLGTPIIQTCPWK